MITEHVPYLELDMEAAAYAVRRIECDEQHRIRRGRRSPVAIPTKPPAERGIAKPIRISTGKRDWWRK